VKRNGKSLKTKAETCFPMAKAVRFGHSGRLIWYPGAQLSACLERGFLAVPAWLIGLRTGEPPERVTPTDALLWTVIHDRLSAGEDAGGYRALGATLGVSVKAALRSIKRLERLGLLDVTRSERPLTGPRRARCNRYEPISISA